MKITGRLFFIFLVTIILNSCTRTEQIKVISLNLRNASDYAAKQDGENRWMNRKEAQLRMVMEEQPDLFAVQECLLVQDEYFISNLKEYSKIGVGRDDGKKEGEFESIFYKKDVFELIDSGNFWLSETPDVPSLGWKGWNYRMVTWGGFQVIGTDKLIYHFNTHLDNTLTARTEGLKLLASKVSEIVPEGASIIITGDFNTSPEEEIMDPIYKIVSDTRKIAPETDTIPSYDGWGGKIGRCTVDYVFESNLKPVKFKTLNGNYGVPFISDHLPVLAILEL